MVTSIFQYCYFSFTGPNRANHTLRARVTDSLCLEWTLFINDAEIENFLDTDTNVLIDLDLQKKLSWPNIMRVYNALLLKKLKP